MNCLSLKNCVKRRSLSASWVGKLPEYCFSWATSGNHNSDGRRMCCNKPCSMLRISGTQWNNNTPYLRSYAKICSIRRPQCVSDDNTRTNLIHSVRMYGWLNWCGLRYSSGFMNTVMRPRLGYMKGEEFVDQFNKENSAPWNQYSTKTLWEKQGKQMTPTCLTCCLNSVLLLFTSPHFI